MSTASWFLNSTNTLFINAQSLSLVTDTVYHYRVAAWNEDGWSYGNDMIVVPARRLLYLCAGEKWTYNFHDLPFSDQVIATNGTNVGTFNILSNLFSADGSVLFEMFRDSIFQPPFSSNVVNFPATNGAIYYGGGPDPAWSDRQGVVRLTVLAGAVVIDSVEFTHVPSSGGGNGRPRYRNTIKPSKLPQPAELGAQFVTGAIFQSAVVRADINAKNLPTQVFVQWGSDTNYGFASGASTVDFDYFVTRDITVSNLPFNSVIHLRVVATNSAGVTYGNDLTVELLGSVAVTEKPTNITEISATLTGIAVPSSSPTTAFFQWGTTTNYGMTTAPQAIGSGSSPVAVQANLSSLVTDTIYHYRLVVSNSSGLAYGSNVVVTATLLLYLYAGDSWTYVFQDLPPAGIYAFPDRPKTASYLGFLPGSFAAGSAMRFELFADSTNQGAFNSQIVTPAGGSSVQWPQSTFWLNDLQGAVRLTMLTGSVVVSSVLFEAIGFPSGGFGAPRWGNTITPTRFPQPATLGTQFISLSNQSAVISADVNAKNLSTGVFVQWGTTTNYSSASGAALINFDYSVRHNITLSNLVPGVAYHARMVATNSAGVTYGRDLPFLAPPDPSAPRLEILRENNSTNLLRWFAQSNRIYRLQQATSLNDWNPLITDSIPSNGWLEFRTSTNPSPRFFRLIAE